VKIQYPDSLDAFNLRRTRSEKNLATMSALLEAEDVFFILQELEAKIGCDKSLIASSIDYRLALLEALNPTFQSLGLSAVPVFGGLIISGFPKGSIIFIGDGGRFMADPSGFFWDNSQKRLGIVQPAPLYPLDVVGSARINGLMRVGSGTIGGAQFQVLQSTAGNEVQRLESAFGTTNPVRSIYQPKLNTTNATVTTMLSVALATDTMITIDATINANRQNGGDRGAFIMRGSFSNSSGTVTQLGTTDSTYVKKITATNWATSFAISGTSVLVQIAGDASHNVMWIGHIVVTNGASS